MCRRVIPISGLFLLLVVVWGGFSPTPVRAQTPTGDATPQPIVIPAGQLPTKTLLASEPLRLRLIGPFDLTYTTRGAETISVYVRSLASNPSPLDTTLEIDDPQGNQVAFNDDLTSDSRDAGVENLLLSAAGTYTIHLNTFDLLEGGGVEVQLITSGSANDTTPDSSSILDTTATLDGKSPGVFTFSGTEGQVVTITAEAINPRSPDLDLSLILYGPDGTQVASDDDTGGSNGLGERDPALVQFSLPQTGEYRIEVSSWFDTPGDFVVKVQAD
jgi:Bacterial pre-peptidase C-terminal domain